MQPGQAARGNADMRLRGFVRPGAKVAGEADAVDDMAGITMRFQQRRQRPACHRADPMSGTLQRGNQGRAHKAGGAQDSKVRRGNGATTTLRFGTGAGQRPNTGENGARRQDVGNVHRISPTPCRLRR
jgi:hypothetical protein